MKRLTRNFMGLVATICLFGGINLNANADVESRDPIKITFARLDRSVLVSQYHGRNFEKCRL